MITRHHSTASRALLVVAAIVTVALCAPAAGLAAPTPVREVLTGNFTNGLEYPLGVAVNEDPASPAYGDVYIADKGHHRVQILSATGAFVAMFGREVDMNGGNICTAVSHDTCQAGVEGPAAGQLSSPDSVAVDQSSGDVWVSEYVFANGEYGLRVQEFTAEGVFVREIGREVNHTTKGNVCSEEEVEKDGVECGGPAQEVPGSKENGAFNFENNGGLLAVGGTEDLLYVGDEGRVQEVDATGKWVGEIPLASIPAEPGSRVQSLALDQETSDVYLVYGAANVVQEVNAEGDVFASIPVSGKEGREATVLALALDAAGRLAVAARVSEGIVNHRFGVVYDAASGRLTSEFAIAIPNGSSVNGVAFGGGGGLYVNVYNFLGEGEVLAYTAQPIGELTVAPAVCAPGAVNDTSVSFACTLNGEVNPEGVAGTEALFEWGTTALLGQRTPGEKVEAPRAVSAVVSVPPNATVHYQLAGTDQNALAPEGFSSEQASASTEPVPPTIAGIPRASFLSSSSAVLFGEVDPENTSTTYEFQYALACTPGGSCLPIGQAADMVATESVQSSQYGRVGTSVEVSGLAPGTTYRYQLAAKNEDGETALNETGGATLPEGTFTTAPAPAPSVSSGAAGGIGVSTATISGSVDPDGAPTSYSFELGVYEGASTQFGVVSSGSAGAGTVPVQETLGLSGLQPDGTYAFRVAIRSGYIDNSERTLHSAPVVFTTGGLPSVLALPAIPGLLPIPAIAFPTEAPGVSTTITKTLTRAQKLAAALKTCKKDYKAKSKRAKCEKTAHKAYGPAKPAKKTRKQG